VIFGDLHKNAMQALHKSSIITLYTHPLSLGGLAVSRLNTCAHFTVRALKSYHHAPLQTTSPNHISKHSAPHRDVSFPHPPTARLRSEAKVTSASLVPFFLFRPSFPFRVLAFSLGSRPTSGRDHAAAVTHHRILPSCAIIGS